MRPNLQETADLVIFTEEILNEIFIFCAVYYKKTYKLPSEITCLYYTVILK